jgi:hypothetical protein
MSTATAKLEGFVGGVNCNCSMFSLSLTFFLLGNLQDNKHEVPVLHMVHIKKDHVSKHSFILHAHMAEDCQCCGYRKIVIYVALQSASFLVAESDKGQGAAQH